MKIIPVPVLEDNYSYIIIDDKTKEAAVVDPAEPLKILNVLSQTGAKITSVFTTHHHWDHSGGNIELVSKKPGLAVYGADARIPEINYVCKDRDELKVGSLTVTALHTPCHTKGHVCYYVVDSATNERAVFTGDTLFIAGCGRFFEGDARDMYRVLFHVLAKLPEDTWVFCGHEYTRANLKFALYVDPHNEALMAKAAWCQDKKITVPSTIGQEMLFNPFFRVNESSLKATVGNEDPVEVLRILREMKNSFR
ncbi:beta-lactamase-like protein [Endogone sp. FLAS-F59071]|nr:beta-lactamase-like protein [Endogone sp. FLAS-F59071]|eukprot:RUS17088.1 beta-lactamase-like protein [Endogone sp. FLAS-F59071]